MAYAGCAIFALTTAALGQNAGPTVEVTTRLQGFQNGSYYAGKEPLVNFLLEIGCQSEYIFRGTNLMPHSDGGNFYQIQATIPKVGPGVLRWGFGPFTRLETRPRTVGRQVKAAVARELLGRELILRCCWLSIPHNHTDEF